MLIISIGKLVEEEKRKKGVVALSTYKSYAHAVGSVLTAAIFIFLFLMQGRSYDFS